MVLASALGCEWIPRRPGQSAAPADAATFRRQLRRQARRVPLCRAAGFGGAQSRTAGQMGRALVARTRAAFGHPINPHLFRDCAATSIAIDNPDHVRIAARLLGHRSLATTDRYYNQAGAVDAVRRHQELVIGIRNGSIEFNRDEEDNP